MRILFRSSVLSSMSEKGRSERKEVDPATRILHRSKERAQISNGGGRITNDRYGPYRMGFPVLFNA